MKINKFHASSMWSPAVLGFVFSIVLLMDFPPGMLEWIMFEILIIYIFGVMLIEVLGK